MPYSGTDVLTQISELARQGAAGPRFSHLLVLARQQAQGDVVKSALRALVGYDALISVENSIREAAKSLPRNNPQLAFVVDDTNATVENFSAVIAAFHKAGFSCPLVFISSRITAQNKLHILALGALDALHRDEVCGLRLRQCFLKLPAAGSANT